MTKQKAVWGEDSDVYVLQDNDSITVVVNSAPTKTYYFHSYSRYIDKLVELSVSGYKIPSKLFAGAFSKVDRELGLE